MSRSRAERGAGTPLGAYVLVDKIGQGGMAEVWTARAPDGELVVVKRILPYFADDPAFVAMLRAEARAMERVDHPGVVKLRGMSGEGEEPYLVLDLVVGLELRRVIASLRAYGPMPPGFGAHIARELARTLGEVHRQKLVHRDLSPSNVMLERDGTVKLLDFGIAKALDATSDELKTRTGVLKGKLSYMSPEQLDGLTLDGRADQFALGAVLWEMLVGRHLFAAATMSETIARVRAGDVPPPSRENPAVPRALDGVCARALSLSRDERFADCTALAAALEPIVAELGWDQRRLSAQLGAIELEPTVSQSLGPARRTVDLAAPAGWRWRWRRPIALIVPVVVVLVIATALLLGGMRRERAITTAPLPDLAPPLRAESAASPTVTSTSPPARAPAPDTNVVSPVRAPAGKRARAHASHGDVIDPWHPR